MSTSILFSFLAFFLYLQLGLHVLFSSAAAKVNRSFFYLCMSLSVWSFGYLFIHFSITEEMVRFWERVSSLGWIYFPFLLVAFFFVLKKEKNILFKFLVQLAFFLAATLFFIQSLLGNLITNDYLFIDGRWIFRPDITSIWYISFMVYLVLSLFLSFYLLINWSLTAKTRKEKKQSKIIMITLTLYFAGILFTNYILPVIRPQDFPGLIHITSFFWVAGFGLAVVRYKFLVINPQTAANDIIANMKELLFFLDNDGNILRINQFTREVLGFEPNEIIDRSFQSLLITKERAKELLKGDDIFEEVKSHDYYLLKKSNEIIPFNLSSAEVKDDDGDVLGTIIVGYDVRYEKMLEEALLESEKKYRSLYSMVRLMCDNVPDLIWAKDLEKRYIFANEATCKKLLHAGYSDEPIGKTDEYFFYREKESRPDDDKWYTYADNAKDSDSLTLEKRKAGRYIESGYIKGDFVHYDVFKAPFIDEQGNLIGLVGCGRDVTQEKIIEEERMQAELELSKEKELLSVTLRSIGDGVISTDIEGRVLLMNEVAEQLTGWKKEECIGTDIDQVFLLLDKNTKEKIDNPVDLILDLGKVRDFELDSILISKTGRRIDVSKKGAPIYDLEGNTIGIVIVFSDITQKQKMEQELVRMQKLETVGILAGGIAHDFNNILTAILGNVSLVIRKLNDDQTKQKSRLYTAEKACLRARGLTKQLLTFAKGGELMKKMIRLNKIIEETILFAVKGSNIEYVFDISSDLKGVEVDESQICQVINNLVINAKQAMPKGGFIKVEARNIDITAESELPLEEGEYVKVDFIDTGSGISAKNIDKIFDPFFSTKKEGTGLGLAISFKIVAKHNGYLQVSSTKGKGSVFTLYLPAAKYDSLLEEETDEENSFHGEGIVVVMDDEFEIRTTLKNMLESLGYDVVCTANGEETLEEIQRLKSEDKKIAFVVVDLIIARGMGGKETIIKIRETDPDITAFVSSGYSNDPSISDYITSGFNGVIEKPYTMSNLIRAIRELNER